MSKIKRSRFKVLDDGDPGVEDDGKIEHVGAELRRARFEKGLTVPFLAESLRIRESYLIAIEEGDYQHLPGPAYALGFVRTYAAYLGLDGREAVQRFKDEAGGRDNLGRSARLAFPSPLADGGRPFGLVLVFALLLGALVYGGWYWYAQRQVGGPDMPMAARSGASPAPPATVSPVPGPPPGAAAPGAAAGETAGGETAGGIAGETAGGATGETAGGMIGGSTAQEADGAALPPAAVATPSFAPSPAPAADPDGSAEPTSGGGRPLLPEGQAGAPGADLAASPPGAALPEGTATGVIIRARRDSWIQIRDEAGGILTSTVLRAGDSYEVPDRAGLVLMTGNAGGIEIVVDGRTLPPLGPEGAIRREISLDRGDLQSGAP